MKILVTGSNGLLGQKIIEQLISKKSLSFSNILGCGKGKNRLEIPGFSYFELDITQEEAVHSFIFEHQPTHIIHTAAQTNVDFCELNQESCWQTNVLATKYIVEACEHVNAHLTHVSTDFIFDGEKGSLYTEDDAPNPVSFYGESKLEAEKIVLQSNISKAILRTILVYGIVKDMSRSNIVLWVKKNLEEGKSIQVVVDQARTPTLAEDLAAACILASFKNAEGIYHVGGPDYMTIYEIACKVAEFFKLDQTLLLPVDSKVFTQPAKRPPKTGFIIEKAKNELGYAPHTFMEGLKILAQQIK